MNTTLRSFSSLAAVRRTFAAALVLIGTACSSGIDSPLAPIAAPVVEGARSPEVALFGKAAKVPVTVFSQDFENSAVDAAWSKGVTTVAPNGQRFLGRFSNDSVVLTLANLPEHKKVTLTFDMYAVGTWDGRDPTWGWDTFAASVLGGRRLLKEKLTIWKKNRDQVSRFTLGYAPYGYPADAIYHYSVTFANDDDTLALCFKAWGLQDMEDESWGVDNVTVVVTP